jgi:tetratricopeptide (TPR) repeat protein
MDGARAEEPRTYLAAVLHRELVCLLLLAALGVAAFVVTRELALSNEALRGRDAGAWYGRGVLALDRGDGAGALDGFRHALQLQPSNDAVRIALARALRTGGDPDQAADLLDGMRLDHPDDPDVNTELARLEVERGRMSAAIRHYQDALDALWAPEAVGRSRDLRVEFIESLLAHGERARALSQTLVLVADLPADRTWQLRAGSLLLASGDPGRALDRFGAVLAQTPHDADALSGAGEASFEVGNYAAALRDFAAVPMLANRLQVLRDVARLVLGADPLAPRLTRAERARRTRQMAAHAIERLDTCAAASPDPAAPATRADLATLAAAPGSDARAADRLDAAEDALDLAARVERTTAGCRPSDPLGQAVLILVRRHALEGR